MEILWQSIMNWEVSKFAIHTHNIIKAPLILPTHIFVFTTCSGKIVVATNVAKFRPLTLNFDWLVVLTILNNMKVSWNDCSQLGGNIKNVPNHQWTNISTAKPNIWFTGIDQHFIWYNWNSVFTQSGVMPSCGILNDHHHVGEVRHSSLLVKSLT